jgi:hypothetical protein
MSSRRRCRRAVVLTCSMSTGRFSDGDVVKFRMGERVELATAREKVLNMRVVVMTGWRLGIWRLLSASCRHSGTQASSIRVAKIRLQPLYKHRSRML